jgi:glucose/arabinose dehydrogenase
MRSTDALALAGALAACTGSSGGGGAAASSLALVDVVTGLGAATDLAFLPDGRMLVTEKDGALRLRYVAILPGRVARLTAAPPAAGARP